MKKLINKGVRKMNNIAKKVAEESPDTLSFFLFYEPKMPEGVKKQKK